MSPPPGARHRAIRVQEGAPPPTWGPAASLPSGVPPESQGPIWVLGVASGAGRSRNLAPERPFPTGGCPVGRLGAGSPSPPAALAPASLGSWPGHLLPALNGVGVTAGGWGWASAASLYLRTVEATSLISSTFLEDGLNLLEEEEDPVVGTFPLPLQATSSAPTNSTDQCLVLVLWPPARRPHQEACLAQPP